MRLRTLLVAGALALGLMAAGSASASANIMWCVGDPPVQVASTTGTQFVVNVQLYTSSPSTKKLLGQFTEAVTTTADGSGGTLVTVVVTGPAGKYVTVVASVNRGKGTVSAQGSGSGEIVVLLDVPIA
jgi:hypothetical protein